MDNCVPGDVSVFEGLFSLSLSLSPSSYLTGNQYSSESQVEAYVRVLRTGCRCIECELNRVTVIIYLVEQAHIPSEFVDFGANFLLYTIFHSKLSFSPLLSYWLIK